MEGHVGCGALSPVHVCVALLRFCLYTLLRARNPHRRPDASEALDEYLGRQEFRQLQLDVEEAQQAQQAQQPLGEPARARDVLPGTRMQLVGAEARQVDRCGSCKAVHVTSRESADANFSAGFGADAIPSSAHSASSQGKVGRL